MTTMMNAAIEEIKTLRKYDEKQLHLQGRQKRILEILRGTKVIRAVKLNRDEVVLVFDNGCSMSAIPSTFKYLGEEL